MKATSKLMPTERVRLVADTIARDIWSVHKIRSGRLLASVTDLFLRSMTQAMTAEILLAALAALVGLDEERVEDTLRTIH